MNAIANFLRRVFTRHPKPAPRFEYHRESELPGDAVELIRAGVINEWRTDPAGERWFVGEIGAVAWYQDNLGGRHDA